MPSSVQLTRDVNDASDHARVVATAPDVPSLLDLVPAPYRPSMQDLVTTVFRAALKSNHARSYVVALEKHKLDGTFPPEIGGRISAPAVQISKEFSAAAQCRTLTAEMDNANSSPQNRRAGTPALVLKKTEVSYLQSLFAEDSYRARVLADMTRVTVDLCQDAGVTVTGQALDSAVNRFPVWIPRRLRNHEEVCSVVPGPRCLSGLRASGT